MAPPAAEDRLIPARMLNEVVYCPRLFYLEHVAGEWEESADTVSGKRVHRRVDAKASPLPEPGVVPDDLKARSVTVSSGAEGIIAKLDLIEADAGVVTPVDYKRGTYTTSLGCERFPRPQGRGSIEGSAFGRPSA